MKFIFAKLNFTALCINFINPSRLHQPFEAAWKGQGHEILLPLTISPGSERNRGFRDGIAPTPGIEVVAALETRGGLNDIPKFLPARRSR